MAQEKVNLTKAVINSEVAPETGRTYLHDAKEAGLVLMITAAGRKTFQVYKKYQGHPVRVTLGTWPEITVEQARKKCREAKVELAEGRNPNEAARTIREEMTLNELFTIWMDRFAKPHRRTWLDDQRRYDNYMAEPMGRKKLSWFTPDRIRSWHQRLTTQPKQRGQEGKTISTGTANRALALLKTVFNQAAPDRPNPCRNVRAFREVSRERFLAPDELRALYTALASPETPDDFRDYILLSLYTGARRNNILSMRWCDINLETQVWTIPADQSKNGAIMRVPLTAPAIEILERRHRQTSSMFVFAGTGKAGHYMEPKRAWGTLLKRAGIADCRLHDLRRTAGSVMAAQGTSIHIIGKALGHQNPASTQVYARLSIDPVREALEAASKAMLEAAAAPPKVVKMRKVGNE
jgi:integrase